MSMKKPIPVKRVNANVNKLAELVASKTEDANLIPSVRNAMQQAYWSDHELFDLHWDLYFGTEKEDEKKSIQ